LQKQKKKIEKKKVPGNNNQGPLNKKHFFFLSRSTNLVLTLEVGNCDTSLAAKIISPTELDCSGEKKKKKKKKKNNQFARD